MSGRLAAGACKQNQLYPARYVFLSANKLRGNPDLTSNICFPSRSLVFLPPSLQSSIILSSRLISFKSGKARITPSTHARFKRGRAMMPLELRCKSKTIHRQPPATLTLPDQLLELSGALKKQQLFDTNQALWSRDLL